MKDTTPAKLDLIARKPDSATNAVDLGRWTPLLAATTVGDVGELSEVLSDLADQGITLRMVVTLLRAERDFGTRARGAALGDG